MNMIDWRYMSDKSDIWGQMGFGDRRTFLILESLLQKQVQKWKINASMKYFSLSFWHVEIFRSLSLSFFLKSDRL